MSKILSAFLLITFSLSTFAGAEKNISTKLNTMMPEFTIDSIEKTPVNNLYMVTSGAQVLYVSNDAKIIIQGDMYDVQNTDKPVNLSDNVRQVAVKGIIDKVDPATMIIYPAAKQKTLITVFTDIDCTYCRALQKEVKELNDAGITVRYMAFPRTPKGTPSYNKAIYVWCASDRNAAYSQAISGKDPAVASCKDPVDEHHKIAEEVGVNVTPVIIMQNGKMIPGYLPAKQLIKVALENV
jgi:thiol:disulfide interchange protein DsbC